MAAYLYMRDYLKLKAEFHMSEAECTDAKEALKKSGDILEMKMSDEKWVINIKKRSEMDALVDLTRNRLSVLRGCSVNISPNPEGGFSAAFLCQMAYDAGIIRCTMREMTARSHKKFKLHVRKFTAYNSAKGRRTDALRSLIQFELQMNTTSLVVETLGHTKSLGSLREKLNNSVSVIIPPSAGRKVSLGLVKMARKKGFTDLRIFFGPPNALPL